LTVLLLVTALFFSWSSPCEGPGRTEDPSPPFKVSTYGPVLQWPFFSVSRFGLSADYGFSLHPPTPGTWEDKAWCRFPLCLIPCCCVGATPFSLFSFPHRQVAIAIYSAESARFLFSDPFSRTPANWQLLKYPPFRCFAGCPSFQAALMLEAQPGRKAPAPTTRSPHRKSRFG